MIYLLHNGENIDAWIYLCKQFFVLLMNFSALLRHRFQNPWRRIVSPGVFQVPGKMLLWLGRIGISNPAIIAMIAEFVSLHYS